MPNIQHVNLIYDGRESIRKTGRRHRIDRVKIDDGKDHRQTDRSSIPAELNAG